MPALLDCPAIESWETLLAAGLPPDQEERYERHLTSCTACQIRLDRAEGMDRLMDLARQIGDLTAVPMDPNLTRVLERLHERTGLDRTTPLAPADLYFLRPADRPDLLGTLGEYEVQEVIGQGGMGVVLKAYEPALHRLVAIKVLATAVAGSVTARRRFTREAQAAAAVCHDHIVTVHGVHEVDGLPYLVMQYIAGESLQDRLDRTGPLEVMEVVRIGHQTAAGLAAAHAQGLIHRDIKPANLLLQNLNHRDTEAQRSQEERTAEEDPSSASPLGASVPLWFHSCVKITDFGLARMVDDIGLTQNGTVAGTPEYMAPEQARGELVDHRADLFSLGSVLYALCTGFPPFRGSTALAVLRQVSEQTPTPIRTLNPAVPAWLEALVVRLLAKDPAERMQSAAEVAILLEGYLAHLRQPTTVPEPELPGTPFNTASQAEGEAGRRWLPFLLLVSLAACCLVSLALLRVWLAAGAGEASPKTKYAQDYSHSFKRDRDISEGFAWDGDNPKDCLQFEDGGLHLVFPTGHPGRRMGTGLRTNFTIKGDFDITVHYEIIKEPELADGPERGTGVYLWVDADTPTMNRAILTREVAPASQYSTWIYLSKEGKGEKPLQELKTFPAASLSGRLRLVRAGSQLSHYVAEGASEEFVLLRQQEFGAVDVQSVRIGGHTGGPKASLEALFTDLQIHAGALPDVPEPVPTPTAGERGWLFAVLLIGLLFALSLIGGVWFLVRQRRGAGQVPAPASAQDEQTKPEAEAPPIRLACSRCGMKLKAEAALVGKKVKCPKCGQTVHVPDSNASNA